MNDSGNPNGRAHQKNTVACLLLMTSISKSRKAPSYALVGQNGAGKTTAPSKSL